MRRIALVTEEGRVRERLRIAGRLRARLAEIQDRRIDLHLEPQERHLQAREALLQAERRLKRAAAALETQFAGRTGENPTHGSDRPGEDLSQPEPMATGSKADAGDRRAMLRADHRSAEQECAAARRAVVRAEAALGRGSGAAESDRDAQLARLVRQTELADMALHLLADDNGWAIRGVGALMRAARRALPRLDHELDGVAEDEPGDALPAPGPG